VASRAELRYASRSSASERPAAWRRLRAVAVGIDGLVAELTERPSLRRDRPGAESSSPAYGTHAAPAGRELDDVATGAALEQGAEPVYQGSPRTFPG
jgi:hypothetical protein